MNKSGPSFLIKLTIFLCPFALGLLAEITLFPLDAFSFRVWEAVSVSKSPWIQQFLPAMPFYPETHIEKTEFGDLAITRGLRSPRTSSGRPTPGAFATARLATNPSKWSLWAIPSQPVRR